MQPHSPQQMSYRRSTHPKPVDVLQIKYKGLLWLETKRQMNVPGEDVIDPSGGEAVVGPHEDSEQCAVPQRNLHSSI